MNWLEALILGIVQGLTEFLPVSSSGHLTIGQTLLGIEFAEGDMLLFDVLVHAATVLSTIVVLWSQVADLMKGTFCTTKWNSEKE
jgi:undecaprenyl-diphosphatase